jgi:hypothetical protein
MQNSPHNIPPTVSTLNDLPTYARIRAKCTPVVYVLCAHSINLWCTRFSCTRRTCNPWFLVANTLRSWSASRRLRIVYVHSPTPLFPVSFHDVAPVCLPYYV